MRKPLIVANWKCNPTTLKETKGLFNSVGKGIKNFKNVEVIICPPFTFLGNIEYKTSNIKLGAQDCFWEEKGAFTGEVSPIILKDLGVEYVIIGHSERRRLLNETDEMVNKKLKAAFKAKLKPILCVGETDTEREEGKTFKILESQLQEDLKGIENWKLKIKNLVLAYEPVWAIGTGKPCLPDEVMTIGLFLRKDLSKIYNLPISKNIRIIYGGSVNSQNINDFIVGAQMDGVLLGGASLNPKEFVNLVKNVSRG